MGFNKDDEEIYTDDENTEEYEDQRKIIKAQAQFLNKVTGDDLETLIILLYKKNPKTLEKISLSVNDYLIRMPDLIAGDITFTSDDVIHVLDSIYSLNGIILPLPFNEIKEKYKGKIKGKDGGPIDYKTIIFLSSAGIDYVKSCFEKQSHQANSEKKEINVSNERIVKKKTAS